MNYCIRQNDVCLELWQSDHGIWSVGDRVHVVSCFTFDDRQPRQIKWRDTLYLLHGWMHRNMNKVCGMLATGDIPLILDVKQAQELAKSKEFRDWVKPNPDRLHEALFDDSNPNRRYGLTKTLFGVPLKVIDQNRAIADIIRESQTHEVNADDVVITENGMVYAKAIPAQPTNNLGLSVSIGDEDDPKPFIVGEKE